MKKLLYLIIALGSIQSSIAQLSVSNTDFIYVKNEMIYVENEINLKDSDSHIFLRNDSQILQKNDNSYNAGIGKLSVLQNGSSNEYQYNYWCSPVGQTSAAYVNSNAIPNQVLKENLSLDTYQNAVFTTDLNGISSPLTISSAWLYKYPGGSDYSDWSHIGSIGNIEPGLGFTMKGTQGSGQNQLYDIVGKPNTGLITNSISENDFALLGNPYPSALDALEYIHDSENQNAITGVLYYWDQNGAIASHYLEDYQGGYASYTISSDGSLKSFTPATFNTYNSDGSLNNYGLMSGSGKIAKRFIPIGQGFMVQGKIGTSGIVKTKNNHRAYYKESAEDSFFFSQENTQNGTYETIPPEYKRFRLNIDFNQMYTRQIMMNFNINATPGFDYGLEAPMGSNPLTKDSYWNVNDTPYIIQALEFDQSLSIPLSIHLNEQTAIVIRLIDVQNFDSNQPIYLHDKEVNTFTDLRNENYTINLSGQLYDDRYEIVFNQETLSNPSFDDNNFSLFYQSNAKSIKINNPDHLQLEQIEIYDLAGKKIKEQSINSRDTTYKLLVDKISTGIYVAKLQTEKGTENLKFLVR